MPEPPVEARWHDGSFNLESRKRMVSLTGAIGALLRMNLLISQPAVCGILVNAPAHGVADQLHGKEFRRVLRLDLALSDQLV